MDFEYSEKVKKLQERLTAFMDEHVYPAERICAPPAQSVW